MAFCLCKVAENGLTELFELFSLAFDQSSPLKNSLNLVPSEFSYHHVSSSMLCDVDIVFRVLLYWRKPSLMPESVKADRQKLLGEVAIMACSLTIVDFFRSLVARRRHAETAALLSGPLRLRKWLSSDPHYIHRTIFYTAVRTGLDSATWGRSKLVEFPPEGSRVVTMLQANADTDEFKKMTLHQYLVTEKHPKTIRPRQCLEDFRKAAAAGMGVSGGVVVQFVDELNAVLGVWVLNMSGWNWDGWQVRRELFVF